MLVQPKLVLQPKLIATFEADDPCTCLYATLLTSTAFGYVYIYISTQKKKIVIISKNIYDNQHVYIWKKSGADNSYKD